MLRVALGSALLLAAAAPAAAAGDPIGSVQGLTTRLLGASYATAINWQVIPADPATGNDVFELDFSANQLVIRGNSGVSLASGLHWYLKYTVNASIAWGRDGTGNQIGSVPAANALPAPSGGVPQRVVSPVKYRYAYNVCTFGYSFAWYDAGMWQAEIDRLAMWGVNLPLAFFIGGQEKVTRELYMSHGLTASEVDAYISGPAFLPWQRMGNMQGWGGPTPPEYWNRTTAMELQLLAAMRSFGMTPVLPGFSGHVPSALPRIYPNSSYTNSPDWCGFPEPYGSDTFLEPTDPLYVSLGAEFNKRVLAAFGDPSGDEVPVFNADQFNEMEPNNSSDVYLVAANNATYQAMVAADPNAIYLMQGWLFHEGYWTQQHVTAYLSGVPHGKLLVLDLNTEDGPIFQLLGDTPWLWNALLVYGGRRGVYGAIDRIATAPYQDRATGNMVGVGITPEAIDQSFVQFDLFWESAWRSQPVADVGSWLDAYATRRYGSASPSAQAAWQTLHDSVLNHPIDTAVSELVPQLGLRMSEYGDATGLLNALRLLVQAGAGGEVKKSSSGAWPGPYSYDLTDITRQFLWNLHSDVNGMLSARFTTAVGTGTLTTPAVKAEIAQLAALLLSIMTTADQVCAADPNFLLGFWTESARAWASASVPGEEELVVFNALNQITLWGPSGQINDYAAKNGWSGLISDYYLQRWSIYTKAMLNSTTTGVPPDWNGAYMTNILNFELGWANKTWQNTYPTTPSGQDPVALAQQVLATHADPGALAGYTVLNNTDAVAPPAPTPNWVFLGKSIVAIGNDCPFLVHGPLDNLAACKAACLANSNCNELNVQADNGPTGTLTSCILRQCIDPLDPATTPYASDWSMWSLNRTGGSVDIFQAWHTDPAVLALLCDADPACQGFNSDGWVKADVSHKTSSQGTQLYVKNSKAGKSTSSAPDAAAAPAPPAASEGAGMKALLQAQRMPSLEEARAASPDGRTVPAGSPPEIAAALESEALESGRYGARGAAIRRALASGRSPLKGRKL